MLRIKIGAKFPSNIHPNVMKDILLSIINNRISTNGYLPDASDIQRTVKSISNGRCTRQMYVFLWINEQIQINTLTHRSQPKLPKKKKLKKKTKDFFDKLKKVKTKESCSICLKEGFKGIKLPCGHVFHKTCIKKACQYDKRCPNCRSSITA